MKAYQNFLNQFIDEGWRDQDNAINQHLNWRKQVIASGDQVVRVSRLQKPQDLGRDRDTGELSWGYMPTEMTKSDAIEFLERSGANPEEIKFEVIPWDRM